MWRKSSHLPGSETANRKPHGSNPFGINFRLLGKKFRCPKIFMDNEPGIRNPEMHHATCNGLLAFTIGSSPIRPVQHIGHKTDISFFCQFVSNETSAITFFHPLFCRCHFFSRFVPGFHHFLFADVELSAMIVQK